MSSTAFRTAVRFALAAAVTIATLSGCAASPGGSGSAADTPTPATSASAPASIDLSVPLHRLETEHEARIGVSAVDTGTGQTISYRAEERFGYASSLKAFVAAGFLSAVPAQKREQVTTWTQEDVDAAGYSPVTSAHVDDGLTLARLAEAAVRDSDNTATNLILEKLGGPAALQGILRGVGDDASVVVADEPGLNVVEPGSPDNTTTPTAFTANLRAFLFGPALDEGDRATLREWMSGNATGDPLIRAGAPEGWKVADKSGGASGMRNDIAIVTPPGRAPIVISIFTVKNAPDAPYDNATVADAAALVLDALR